MHLGLGGIPSSKTPLLLQERPGSLIRTSREAESQPRPALLGRHRRDPGRAPSTVKSENRCPIPPSSPSWERAGISLSLNF